MIINQQIGLKISDINSNDKKLNYNFRILFYFKLFNINYFNIKMKANSILKNIKIFEECYSFLKY